MEAFRSRSYFPPRKTIVERPLLETFSFWKERESGGGGGGGAKY